MNRNLFIKKMNKTLENVLNERFYKKTSEILKFLNEKKKFIFVSICIFVTITIGYFFFNVFFTSSVNGEITYYYEGVEKGFDPAGRYLDPTDIKNEKVLKNVVDNLKLKEIGVDENILKNGIDVYPISSGSSVSKIKNLEEEKEINIQENKGYTYFPTKYRMVLR